MRGKCVICGKPVARSKGPGAPRITCGDTCHYRNWKAKRRANYRRNRDKILAGIRARQQRMSSRDVDAYRALRRNQNNLWRKKNRSRHLAKRNEWYRKNRSKAAAYYKANRQKIVMRLKAWKQKNAEKVRAHGRAQNERFSRNPAKRAEIVDRWKAKKRQRLWAIDGIQADLLFAKGAPK